MEALFHSGALGFCLTHSPIALSRPVLGNSSGTQSQTWVISLLLLHGVLCAGLKILVGWALEFRHFWGFNQASKLAFSAWSQIKIALVLILLTSEYEVHKNSLHHQWKGCRRTPYWTLPEAGSVKLKCRR